MANSEVLSKLLLGNNGYLKTSDAVAAGVSRNAFGDFAHKLEFERVARGTANSRMRDFYDIYLFINTQTHNIDNATLKEAFEVLLQYCKMWI